MSVGNSENMGMVEERKWQDLNVDCLAYIFSKVDLEDLILSVPFVCKPWHQTTFLNPQCWQILNFRTIFLMPRSSFIAKFERDYRIERFSFAGLMKLLVDRSCGSVVEIAFPTEFGASLQDLVYASIKCPKLRVLTLPNLFYQEEKHIPEFIGKWKDLEILEMRWKASSLAAIVEQVSLHCKNFVGLRLFGWIDNDDAMAIVKHLPKLKCLVMSGSFLPKDALLAILDGCKHLEAVDVSRCVGFDSDDVEILKTGSCIQAFKYEGVRLREDCFDYVEYEDVFWGLVF